MLPISANVYCITDLVGRSAGVPLRSTLRGAARHVRGWRVHGVPLGWAKRLLSEAASTDESSTHSLGSLPARCSKMDACCPGQKNRNSNVDQQNGMQIGLCCILASLSSIAFTVMSEYAPDSPDRIDQLG